MIRMSIAERSGQPRQFTFPKDDITIGRAQGNDIILPRNNISKRHTRIFRRQGKLVVRDLDSTNGTFLNGRRIHDDEVLHAGDRIFLADFVLIVEEDESAATPVPPELRPSVPPPLPPGEGGEEEIPEVEAKETTSEDESAEIALGPGDVETAPPDMVLSDLAKVAARRTAPTQPELTPPPVEPPSPFSRTVETPAPARPSRIAAPAPMAAPTHGRRGPEIAQASAPAAPGPSAPFGAEEAPRPAPAPRASRAPAPAPARPESLDGETPKPAAAKTRGRPAPAEHEEKPAPAARASQVPKATARPAAKAEPAARPAPKAAPRPAATLSELEIGERLLARVNEVVRLKEAEPAVFGDPELQAKVKSAVLDELAILEAEDLLDAGLDRDRLVEDMTSALFGLGPFPALAADAAMEAFLAYPDGSTFERRGGKWHRAVHRLDSALLSLLARRIAAGISGRGHGGSGDSFRGQHPQLPGVEVCGALGGSMLSGAMVRLERPAAFPHDFDALADAGVLSVPMATFLKLCVETRQALAVVGPQRAARSAVLRALATSLPSEQRVVWLAEAGGGGPPSCAATVVTVTPPSVGESLLEETDDGGAGPTELIQWLQPDLVVIERADAARDCALVRSMRNRAGVVVLGIEAERWEAGAAEPAKGAAGTPPAKSVGPAGVDPRLAAHVDVVAEITPLVDGSTRTIRIGERAADGGDPFALTAIFEFFVSGAVESGELAGEYRPTRAVPRFVERRKARGKRVDMSLFQG